MHGLLTVFWRLLTDFGMHYTFLCNAWSVWRALHVHYIFAQIWHEKLSHILLENSIILHHVREFFCETFDYSIQTGIHKQQNIYI